MIYLSQGVAFWQDQGEIAGPKGEPYDTDEVQGICYFPPRQRPSF